MRATVRRPARGVQPGHRREGSLASSIPKGARALRADLQEASCPAAARKEGGGQENPGRSANPPQQVVVAPPTNLAGRQNLRRDRAQLVAIAVDAKRVSCSRRPAAAAAAASGHRQRRHWAGTLRHHGAVATWLRDGVPGVDRKGRHERHHLAARLVPAGAGAGRGERRRRWQRLSFKQRQRVHAGNAGQALPAGAVRHRHYEQRCADLRAALVHGLVFSRALRP